MLVVLAFELVGQGLTDSGACWEKLAQDVPGVVRPILTNTSGPQTEGVRDFFDNCLAVFYLTKKNPVVLDFHDAGIDQNFDAVAGETTLDEISIKSPSSASK